MIGKTLGHFDIIGLLGQGGMGAVYLAEDRLLRRRVAIKLLSDSLPDASRRVGRLRREAEALAAVNHPNVITVHAIENVDGVPFVVMELVEGKTVSDLLPEGGFPTARFFELAIPIASAIDAAHARGVVHGDLKPGNVMVSSDGRVKVLDFGLSRIVIDPAADADDRTTTVYGAIAGTFPYMALEQLVGEPPDRKSDLFSLGVLLFEMAIGRIPFEARSVPERMRRLAAETAPDVHTLRDDLPRGLGRLMVSLLDREPANRPATAAIVADALEECSRERARAVPVRESVTPRPSRRTPADVEVMQLVAHGRHLWNRRSEDSLHDAITCFRQAIDRDPLYAPAWIGLADAINILANYGFVPPGDSHVRVRAAVEKAIALGGETADALRALALAAWQFDFDWERAEQLYRRAIVLDDAASLSHYWYGVLLGVTRRFDECFEEMRRAEALDPLSLMPPAARGWFTIFAGHPAEGHVLLRRVLAIDAHLHPALWFDAQALSALGRHDEAVASFEDAIRLGGRTRRMLSYLGYALGHGGREQEARGVLDELISSRDEQYVPPCFEALIRCGLGETGRTLDLLEAAFDAKDTMLRDLAVDPPWWELREEPRYRDLVARMRIELTSAV
jgi:tRNA A-37 threonylcarbamoyl transferase component Bud32/tetratricopeptide (TPR) repeat protein